MTRVGARDLFLGSCSIALKATLEYSSCRITGNPEVSISSDDFRLASLSIEVSFTPWSTQFPFDG